MSRNGKFVAAALYADVTGWPGGYSAYKRQIGVGVIDVSSLELRWVAELISRGGNDIIRQMTVSEDGRYIAIGSWDNGAVVVDAANEKVLWNKPPPKTADCTYVAFSADASRLFVGDSTQGCVFVLDTLTGDVVSQWFCTETGEEINGHRVSCLAVSPDDSWVAAGTGPGGQVYLINAKSGEKPVILPHNRGTILMLSFSPDSKRLASMAGGQIKIWDIPTTTGPSVGSTDSTVLPPNAGDKKK